MTMFLNLNFKYEYHLQFSMMQMISCNGLKISNILVLHSLQLVTNSNWSLGQQQYKRCLRKLSFTVKVKPECFF